VRPLIRGFAAAAIALATLAGTTAVSAQASAAAPVRAAPAAEYRLGAGDVVRITVFQNPELTLESRLTEGGQISFPLLGAVRLGGLSVTEAEKVLVDGLTKGNFLRNPQVTIIVLQVRGSQANVLGQVNRPGRYPLEMADTRLTDLVALAGGVAPGGADVIVITGLRNGQAFREEVDLPALFAPGGQARDIVVRNGDAIWVDRQPIVYIYGEVQRPGPMRLERGLTLLQALATGGGLTPRGTEKGIRVHRKSADGQIEVSQPAMTDLLREGDVVFVRESLF
jgi:polysaccharide export outer membrane protein